MVNARYEFYIFARNGIPDSINEYFGLTVEYGDGGVRVNPPLRKSLEGIGLAALNKHELKGAKIFSNVPSLEAVLERITGLRKEQLRDLSDEEVRRAGISNVVEKQWREGKNKVKEK